MEINNDQDNPQAQNEFDPAKRRELKKQYMEGKQSSYKAKRVGRWVVGAVVILAAVAGLWLLSRGGGGVSPEQQAGILEVSETDWTKGPDNAPVTMVEYGDFQCPACAVFHPIVQQVAQQFPDDLRVVFRHFPLTQIHPFAFISAKASEAAGKQGKFWEMHDVLFENQNQWVTAVDKEEAFALYAGQLGLDKEQFLADLDSRESDGGIRDDAQSATAARVNATPTFFVNGVKITNPSSVHEFVGVINAALDSLQTVAQ